MTRRHLVAMTIIVLGFASGAFAQTADDASYLRESPRTIVRMDPLDPVSRAAILAAIAAGSDIATPTTTPSGVVFFPAPEAPAPAPQPTRVVVEQRPAGPSRLQSVLQGISETVQTSHEVLGLYEHGIEANALKNYYNSGR